MAVVRRNIWKVKPAVTIFGYRQRCDAEQPQSRPTLTDTGALMTRELMATIGWFVDFFRPASAREAAPVPYRWQPAVEISDGRTACTLMDFSYS